MKQSEKEKNSNKVLLIVLFSIAALALIIFLFFLKPKEEQKTEKYKGWMENVDRITQMNVADFANNLCGRKYYSPEFKLDDKDVLFSYNGDEIQGTMFSLLSTRYGECDTYLIFVSSLNGSLYYINNFEDSSYDKYQLVLVPDVSKIVSLTYVDVINKLIAFDYEGTEYDITDIIDEIVRK